VTVAVADPVNAPVRCKVAARLLVEVPVAPTPAKTMPGLAVLIERDDETSGAAVEALAKAPASAAMPKNAGALLMLLPPPSRID
jgi:hypothetical protein